MFTYSLECLAKNPHLDRYYNWNRGVRMKCPKCSFENPTGTRYCQHCGSDMIPPIPQENHASSLVSTKRNPFRSILLFFLIIFVLTGVVLSIVVYGISRNSESTNVAVTETIPGVPVLPEEEEPVDETDNAAELYASDYFSEFVDLDKRTIKLPESEMVLSFPEYSDYQFDYDPERESLLFEVITPDQTVVTIASSQLHASPFTKSEAEASQRQGLYYKIEGDEDEYYYMLPASGSIVNGTIIDCNYNRSTTITVYSQLDDYAAEESGQVSSQEAAAAQDSSAGSFSSNDQAIIEEQTENYIEETEPVPGSEYNEASGLESAEIDNETALPDSNLIDQQTGMGEASNSSESAESDQKSGSNEKGSTQSKVSKYRAITMRQLEMILESSGISRSGRQ